MEVLGSLFALAAWVILVVNIPMCAYYTIRLANHRRTDLPRSWHDFWCLNRANLLFFPHLLTDTGKAFQKKGMRAALWILGGAVLAMLAFSLLENT
ncbi:MAG: hypothetical protein AAFY15_00380 [Cyanobacteria bacterium J06648_11]